MKHKLDGYGLLLTARDQLPDSPCLVVTVGLLVDSASGTPLPTQTSWEWITERFAGMAFDRGLKKNAGTFAVHGKAFPLTESQRQGMAVHVQLGARQKCLHIFAPRVWHKAVLGWQAKVDGRLSATPLDFAHTFGGPAYADNPEGLGHAGTGNALAPIEAADCPVRDPDECPPPATFLPLPPQSAQRRVFMGTLDEHWKNQRAPWLPLDTDPRWFNEVPEDQCIKHYWRGDESWSASGMHPQQAHLSGTLPGLRPRLFVEYHDSTRAFEEASLDLDTVWLFPDAERLLLLYRARIAVVDPDANDIAALGMGCECREDPRLSTQAWRERLWPSVCEPEPPLRALTTFGNPTPEASMCSALQAAADRIYADVAQAFEQSLKVAQKMAARTGQVFDSQSIQPPVRPDIATMLAQGNGPAARPFDAVALEADIRNAVAEGGAAARAQVQHIAKRLKCEPQALYAQTQSDQAPQPCLNASALTARLRLPAAENAKLQAELTEGLSKARAMEVDIDTKVAAMREQLLENAALLPKPPATQACTIDWSREHIKACHDAGQSLVGLRFLKLDLSALDLTEADLRGCRFEGCRLHGTQLHSADLRDSVFIDCAMSGIELQRARMEGVFLQRCCLDASQLAGVLGTASYAQGSSFVQAQLAQASFLDAHFTDCDFFKADLTGAMMSGARFNTCVFDAACASEADMANSQWQGCTADGLRIGSVNLQGASWSAVIGRNIDARSAQMKNLRVDLHCELPTICLDKANLQNASLQHANLRAASLREALLDHALLSHCDLRDSDGYRLTACKADFTGSDFSGACWVGANLMDSRLRKVILDSTDLSGSNLFAAFTEAARGKAVRLDHALLGRCRLIEDLARA